MIFTKYVKRHLNIQISQLFQIIMRYLLTTKIFSSISKNYVFIFFYRFKD